MNTEEIKRTVDFAPIMELIYEREHDYQKIAISILQHNKLTKTAKTLQKSEQDWKPLALNLMEEGLRGKLYLRCKKVIEAVKKYPNSTYEKLADVTGMNVVTVRQTIGALEKGGMALVQAPAPSSGGRPRKQFKLKSVHKTVHKKNRRTNDV